MVDDRRLTISSSSRLHPDEISRRTFATTRRGFNPSEVKAFLELVGRELAAAEEREHELRELLADAERRAQNPVLDEVTLTTALGQETAKVLRSAHEASAEVVARAEADAHRMVTEAHEEAGRLQARAEQNAADRAAQSEAVAAETRRRAQEESAGRIESARTEAEGLLEQARSECRAMLTEAQELRARVLGDLTRRRRVLHSQIEQLRAGRERLAETLSGARHTVDRITDELFRAEEEARLAAEAAGRHQALATEHVEVPPEGTPELAAGDRGVGPEVVEGDEASVSGSPGAEAKAGVRGDSDGRGPVEGVEGAGRRTAAAATSETEKSVKAAPNARAAAGAETSGTTEHTVEELFARLRSESAAGAEAQLDSEPPEQMVKTPPSGNAAVEAPADAVTEAVSIEDVTEAVPVAAEPEADTATEETPADDPLLSKRNEVLSPIIATLARRLKRALTDDQNDILDRLRARRGWGPEILAAKPEQLERYAKASQDALSEAARAGASFAGGKASDAPEVAHVATDLAEGIVVPLRRRLEGEEEGIDAQDDAFLVEHVGAAFRDWKGARIERLAGDQAVAAFSLGELSTADPKTSFRWVVDDDGAECPDCDDNALAGVVASGETFPTGHLHPPAHSGCRCLLAPLEA